MDPYLHVCCVEVGVWVQIIDLRHEYASLNRNELCRRAHHYLTIISKWSSQQTPCPTQVMLLVVAGVAAAVSAAS
jgi:hypothetical protein